MPACATRPRNGSARRPPCSSTSKTSATRATGARSAPATWPTAGRHLPPVGSSVAQTVSRVVHFALYVMLLAAVILGVANVWVRGDTIFGLFSVPAFDPGDKALRAQVEDLHGLGANVLLILAGL